MRSENFKHFFINVFCLFALLLLSLAVAELPGQAQNSKSDEEPLTYSEERPANFIFLLDVSGSMLYDSEKVKAQDGSLVTLFEALRQALKQIVQDERLVTSKSKIAFITFGTAITEKSTWPGTLATAKERADMLARISSAEELQADKHGDTYMAGGLAAAFYKATQFTSESPPCTTTFIVMLTDGWDEPPADATCKVSNEAMRFRIKENDLKTKLGVTTWQIKVIGLQHLPSKKAGTTTAVELAKMLGGEFIDVSQAKTGTIAESIYKTMKHSMADLAGEIDFAPCGAENVEVLDFGRMGQAPPKKSFVVFNHSCYVEKLTGVKDACAKVKPDELHRVEKLIAHYCAEEGRFPDLPAHGRQLTRTSDLPAGAISLKLDAPVHLLAPVEQEGPAEGKPSAEVGVTAQVGSSCPPGAYLGFMAFNSTAKTPSFLPYVLVVPSRLTVDREAVRIQVRKPGFIFDRDTSTELAFGIGARVASSHASDFDVVIQAGPAAFKGYTKVAAGAGPLLASKLINNGEPLSTKVMSGNDKENPVRLEMQIPAETEPGKYEGTISVKLKEPNELVSNTSVPYVVEVLPSPWDEMSPIAVPILVVLLLVAVTGIYMAVVGSRGRI